MGLFTIEIIHGLMSNVASMFDVKYHVIFHIFYILFIHFTYFAFHSCTHVRCGEYVSREKSRDISNIPYIFYTFHIFVIYLTYFFFHFIYGLMSDVASMFHVKYHCVCRCWTFVW